MVVIERVSYIYKLYGTSLNYSRGVHKYKYKRAGRRKGEKVALHLQFTRVNWKKKNKAVILTALRKPKHHKQKHVYFL